MLGEQICTWNKAYLTHMQIFSLYSVFGYRISGAMICGVWQGAICSCTSGNVSLPWSVRKNIALISPSISMSSSRHVNQKRGKWYETIVGGAKFNTSDPYREQWKVRAAQLPFCHHGENTCLRFLDSLHQITRFCCVISFKSFDQLMDLDLTLDSQYQWPVIPNG